MWRGISLANKCLLLFGAAVVLIIVSALAVPWFRLNSMVEEGRRDSASRLVLAWERIVQRDAAAGKGTPPGVVERLGGADIVMLSAAMAQEQIDRPDPDDTSRFVKRAWNRFAADDNAVESFSSQWRRSGRLEWYAKAVRADDDSLQGMILLTQTNSGAAWQLVQNTIYLLAAGLIALGLAVLVFYLITNRLILSPVRSLKETAESVRLGNLSTRSSIDTGDEFEELSDTFNQMLEGLQAGSDQLRAINTALDVRVGELAERNLALHEANRVKGEFLANVSHELRTPLNSIIGFAELLLEIAEKEAAAGDDSTRLTKRRRYLEHIITAGKTLLEMINSLLEMAKVEAGRTALHLETINVADTCNALAAMLRPLADKSGVDLAVEISPDLPLVETDPKKLQQIVFNLLSNAIKFTGDPARADEAAAELAPGAPKGGRVVLRAEKLVGRASEGAESVDRVRISVLDTGPGIAEEDLPKIFEKFRQLESGITRRHAGTGLGLAISKELTSLLQGEIHVQSELGRGSMFSLILPLHPDPTRAAEMRLEMQFRGALASQKVATETA
ncbi:MAG: HAMP domain-containing histidine kinase [Phycisphaeraceae bacterium]|nr:HAMP domain-containing histidine kinase [Phycisphaeraceae bacterium]